MNKPVTQTTEEEMRELMNGLPDKMSPIFYQTEAYKFLCRKIDDLIAEVEKCKNQ